MHNQDIRRKFKLRKTQLDGIIARFGKEWNLDKDLHGRWKWPEQAVKSLIEYLKTRGEVKDIESRTNFTKDGDGISGLNAVLELHFLKLKESQSSDVKTIRGEMAHFETALNRVMHETKNAHREVLTLLEHKVLAIQEKANSALAEKERQINALLTRLDRRQRSATFFQKIWKVLNAPILKDRRRQAA